MPTGGKWVSKWVSKGGQCTPLATLHELYSNHPSFVLILGPNHSSVQDLCRREAQAGSESHPGMGTSVGKAGAPLVGLPSCCPLKTPTTSIALLSQGSLVAMSVRPSVPTIVCHPK